jgi:hypothetical protein
MAWFLLLCCGIVNTLLDIAYVSEAISDVGPFLC